MVIVQLLLFSLMFEIAQVTHDLVIVVASEAELKIIWAVAIKAGNMYACY